MNKCHMCRRDRDHLSCMDCSRYGWRNWSESLELGIIASVAMLLISIITLYLLGIG